MGHGQFLLKTNTYEIVAYKGCLDHIEASVMPQKT